MSKSFLIALLATLIFGVLLVYDASVVYSLNVFGGEYHFLIKQLSGVLAGLVAMYLASKVDLNLLKKLSFPLVILTLALLFLVLLPSFGNKFLGARRWLGVGELSLQPSELAKLSFIIYFSFIAKKLKEKSSLLPFLLIFCSILGLILLQPDLGTALVVGFVGVGLYFLSGAPLRHFFILVPLVLIAGLTFIMISPYRRNRLMAYLRPVEATAQEKAYHQNQVLIAIGSGGVFGLGPGKSRQKYSYLPEASSDSIFAILCEEFGFVGALLYLGVLSFLIYKCFQIASQAKNLEPQLLASGVGLWVAGQSALNLGSTTGILPLTGVPLPLVSYGGSAIVFLLAGLGLVVNVGKAQSAKFKA